MYCYVKGDVRIGARTVVQQNAIAPPLNTRKGFGLALQPKDEEHAGILVNEQKSVLVPQPFWHSVVIGYLDLHVLENAGWGWSAPTGLCIHWMFAWTPSCKPRTEFSNGVLVLGIREADAQVCLRVARAFKERPAQMAEPTVPDEASNF